ncbi:MAG: hypothetical protein FJZ63_02420 [Chlamydiae bacterium]|nr:hypothetical protein [Chlamydiota bacterium]
MTTTTINLRLFEKDIRPFFGPSTLEKEFPSLATTGVIATKAEPSFVHPLQKSNDLFAPLQ